MKTTKLTGFEVIMAVSINTVHVLCMGLGVNCVRSRKVAGSSPDEVIEMFQFTQSFQPLTDVSTKDLPERKARPARKAYNRTAFCEPIA
jgi:hypothetical protein